MRGVSGSIVDPCGVWCYGRRTFPMNTLFRTGILLSVVTSAAMSQTKPPPVSASPSTGAGTNEYHHSDIVAVSDDTHLDITASGSFTATFHTRSKILTARGRRYTEVPIPFNSKH